MGLKKKPRLWYLDVVRSVAVLPVVISHFEYPFFN